MRINKFKIYCTVIGLSFLSLFSSCSKDDDLKETNPDKAVIDRYEGLDDFQRESLAYFKEICLGFEYGNQFEKVRKWSNKDTLNLLFEYRSPEKYDQGSLIQPNYYPMAVPALPGTSPAPVDIRIQRRNELLKNLKETVAMINNAVGDSGFHINVVESDGNLYKGGMPLSMNMPNNQNSVSTQKHNSSIVFASRDYFLWKYQNVTQLQASAGNGALWTIEQNDNSNPARITGCRILCVLDQYGAYDNNLAVLKSFIKEELIQPLGFFRDSEKHPSSIFYETATDGGFATELSDLDKELMRLMYHPKMEIGASGMQAEKTILEIYREENRIKKKENVSKQRG